MFVESVLEIVSEGIRFIFASALPLGLALGAFSGVKLDEDADWSYSEVQ